MCINCTRRDAYRIFIEIHQVWNEVGLAGTNVWCNSRTTCNKILLSRRHCLQIFILVSTVVIILMSLSWQFWKPCRIPLLKGSVRTSHMFFILTQICLICFCNVSIVALFMRWFSANSYKDLPWDIYNFIGLLHCYPRYSISDQIFPLFIVFSSWDIQVLSLLLYAQAR